MGDDSHARRPAAGAVVKPVAAPWAALALLSLLLPAATSQTLPCGEEGLACCPTSGTAPPCGERGGPGFLECLADECMPCGARGEPACTALPGTTCDLTSFGAAAFENDAGECEPCGDVFEPACPRLEQPCDPGRFLDPIGLCAFAECGVPGNTCCPSLPCGTEFLVDTGVLRVFDCGPFNICTECGKRGLRACTQFELPACDPESGVGADGVCVECGAAGQPGCVSDEPCDAGLVVGASGVCGGGDGEVEVPSGQYGQYGE